jgi:hypothetical protein
MVAAYALLRGHSRTLAQRSDLTPDLAGWPRPEGRDQNVIMSPLRFNLVEDQAQAAMNLLVDQVERVRHATAWECGHLDRLPVGQRMRIEAMSESYEQSFPNLWRHTGGFVLPGRRVSAKEVLNSRVRHDQSLGSFGGHSGTLAQASFLRPGVRRAGASGFARVMIWRPSRDRYGGRY